MKKLAWLFAALLLGAGFSAGAQGKRVVLVVSTDKPAQLAIAAAFQAASPAKAEVVNLMGSDEKQRVEGEKLQASPPGFAILIGDLAAQMAKWRLEGVPAVYCDAIRAGKIGLSGPQVRGVYHEPSPADQLAAIPAVFPGRKAVGLIYCRAQVKLDEAALKSQAASLGLTLVVVNQDNIKSVPATLPGLLAKVQVLWVLTDPEVVSSHGYQYIVMQGLSRKVPIFCGEKELARAGAAAALIPDPASEGAKAAELYRALAAGKAPPPSPVYPAGRLLLSYKMAAGVNLTFPPEAAARAFEIIQ